MLINLMKFENLLMELNPKDDDFTFLVNSLLDDVDESIRKKIIPSIFKYFEKYPLSDTGCPGFLIHHIESFYPDYTKLLIDSIKNNPSINTLQMLNRILNSDISKKYRDEYMGIFFSISNNDKLDVILRNEARDFIKFQNNN